MSWISTFLYCRGKGLDASNLFPGLLQFSKGLGAFSQNMKQMCLFANKVYFLGCRFRQSVRKLGCRRCERTAMLFYPKTLRKDTDLMSRNQILTLNSIGRILCSSTHLCIEHDDHGSQLAHSVSPSVHLFSGHTPQNLLVKELNFMFTLRSIIYDRLDFWIALAPCVAMLWGLHLLDLHLTTGALTSAFQWCCIENKFS